MFTLEDNDILIAIPSSDTTEAPVTDETTQSAERMTPTFGRTIQGYGFGDLAGGAAAAMVVLPQAMAYGVALFSLMGMSAASGALAGLVGAACLSLVSGVLGGTIGLVSSPTGPALVLFSGAILAFEGAGITGEQLFTALMATTVLAGLLQAMIAVSGGGRLIKFIPYPVVVGFTTGAALLMIQSQLKPIFGPILNHYLEAWRWIPFATAAATYFCVTASSKWTPKLPPMVAGLVGGTLIFHLLAETTSAPIPDAWVVGSLPDPASIVLGLSIVGLAELPLMPVLSAAIALAMLASLNTMLASVVADMVTENRHNALRELLAQGAGQTLTGLLGSMGGSGTTGATVVAVSAGARRWAGATAGAVFVLLVLFFGPAGKLLPIGMLAGIVIYVAIGMIGGDALEWVRSGRTRMDALVALLVTIVTVVYDLVTAVGAGVVIAIVLFIREQARTSVVHRRSSGAQRHSVRLRTEKERALLAQHGDRIVIYELRGNLFFATADRLFEELLPDLERPAWVILHLRRVSQVDLTGIKILHQIATRLHAHGGQLLFCEVHREVGLGTDVGETLVRVSQKGTGERKALTFVGSEEALEHAENALLTELGSPPAEAHERVELAATDLCRGMTADQVSALQSVLSTRTAEAGRKLFAAGERGGEMYIVVRGEVDLRLQTTRHHYKRLANCGPGTFFGEIAFLEPGPRTADAVVVQPTELLVLDRRGLEHLERSHPDAAVSLLVALGKMQGQHLRRSDEEIQRLAQW
jgi:SulP family sulfate permease